MALTPLGSSYPQTRDTLHVVAAHIVARARLSATGRFGLRVTAGGFGTPEFGDDLRRVRVSGSMLVIESGAAGAASSRVMSIDNASLSELAAFASLDLVTPINIGHDAVELPDPEARLTVDAQASQAIGTWYEVTSRALDRVSATIGGAASASLIQLWPEHFDVAFDVSYDDTNPTTHRVNLGGSPGDGYESMPYAYIGPWNSDRPGDPAFWNAPFGAVLRYADIAQASEPVEALCGFYLDGLRRLRG